MRIINHHQRLIFVRQFDDSIESGNVAIHAEYAIGRNQAGTVGLCLLQLFFEIGHICVGITQSLRLAQTYAVYDGSMVQRITDDGIMFIQQGFEQPGIGIETGCVEDGIVGVEETGNRMFQLLV